MKLKTTEKGFTLIELLVGIAILAFVVGAASMTVITMMRLSPQSNNWAIALRQVQNAGYWISRDVQSSNAVNTSPPSPKFLVFTIPTGPSTSKQVEYEFEGSGNLKKLTRKDTGQTMMVAQYIYYNPGDPDNSTKATYDSTSRKLTFTTAATSGKTTVTRQYEATQRVPP